MKLVLIGFMGSGKSTIGRKLARRLGIDFFDTDELIQRKTRLKISDIFKTKGEGFFREQEEGIIQNLADKNNCVISAGGGAVLKKTNVFNLKKNGLIIYLKVPLKVLKERLAEVTDRPLLGEVGFSRGKKIEEMFTYRQKLYEKSADLIIDCGIRKPEEIVDEIIKKMAYQPKVIKTRFSRGLSQVLIGNEIFTRFSQWWKWEGKKVALVTHPFLARCFFDKVVNGLEPFSCQVELITIPSGERSKSLRMVEKIYSRLFQKEFLRTDFVLALGGGVVGDVAGFVAATYMRGLNLIQVPTTLLSQIDSSIGGKTGVNVPYGKNLIGSFYQPLLTLIDLSFLKTLPKKEVSNGLAEMIKMGFLFSPALVKTLEEHLEEILRLKPEIWQKVVTEVVSYKLKVVKEDEIDTKGLRAFLNYGHTVGHALEKLASYREISHGEAVAIGMMVEGKISEIKGISTRGILERQKSLLERVGLPVMMPEKYRSDLAKAMLLDKKRENEEIKFVGVEEIGKPVLFSLTLDELREIMRNLAV